MNIRNPRVKMVASLVQVRPGILTREIASYLRVCDATARSALNTAEQFKMVERQYDYGSQGWPAVWYPVDL